jgi:hypothetical protein
MWRFTTVSEKQYIVIYITGSMGAADKIRSIEVIPVDRYVWHLEWVGHRIRKPVVDSVGGARLNSYRRPYGRSEI